MNASTVTVLKTYGYDYSNRLVSIDQSNNAGTAIRPVNYIYNELGQLVNKKLHSTDQVSYMQNVDYRYDINQHLTSINNSTLSVDAGGNTNSDGNDLFGEEVLYEKTDANIGNTAFYNGNISAVKWDANAAPSGNSSQRSYLYTYDQLNRLTNAYYKDRAYQNTGAWGNNGYYDEKAIQYDLQGNIEKLSRYSNNVLIDNLTYAYTATAGNQLTNVSDAGTTAGFNSAASSSPYVYDLNGNLATDTKRGPGGTTIGYNIFNRTDKINFTGTAAYIRYTYDASGNILRKEAFNGSITNTYDYVDGFVYLNQGLSYFQTEEGRVRYSSGTFTFEYFFRDHLGNVRASFDGGGSLLLRQETSYYPFGMAIQSISPSNQNNNLFNDGSELQNDMTYLPDFYQTPNRNYDAVLGRFVSVDEKAEMTESVSTFQFAGNNPISNNDPTGLFYGSMAAAYDNLYSETILLNSSYGLITYSEGGTSGAGTSTVGDGVFRNRYVYNGTTTNPITCEISAFVNSSNHYLGPIAIINGVLCILHSSTIYTLDNPALGLSILDNMVPPVEHVNSTQTTTSEAHPVFGLIHLQTYTGVVTKYGDHFLQVLSTTDPLTGKVLSTGWGVDFGSVSGSVNADHENTGFFVDLEIGSFGFNIGLSLKEGFTIGHSTTDDTGAINGFSASFVPPGATTPSPSGSSVPSFEPIP